MIPTVEPMLGEIGAIRQAEGKRILIKLIGPKK